MKRIFLITFLCVNALFQLHAQNKIQENAPDEQTIVNKQYDENGNLIQYDSTYVHQWSSDSTFIFPFDDHFAFGGNMEELMQHLMGDSIMANFGFPHEFDFSPFDDNFLNPMMSDSMFVQRFHMHPDSLYNFHRMFPDHLQNRFDFPDMQALQKQLEEELNLHGYKFPEFKSHEQKDEWDKLIEKQKKEQDELIKKWEKESTK